MADLIIPGLLLLGFVTLLALVWLASREQDARMPRNSFYGRDRSQQRYRQAWRVDKNTRHTMIGVVLVIAILVVPYLVDQSSAIAISSMVSLAMIVWEISENNKARNNKAGQISNPIPPPLPPASPSQPTASSGTYSKVYKQSRKVTPPSTPAQPVKSPIPDTFTPSPHPVVMPEQRIPSNTTVQRLLTLTNGDQRLARRLLQSVMDRHPDKSEVWCYEKVVYDLERDRQRG